MKIKTIVSQSDRYDETHPNSWEYIVLWIDSYDETNPNMPYKWKTIYTIWTWQFYEQYDSACFEIIDSRISKHWHFNVMPSHITMGIKYWIEDIYFSYNVLHEKGSTKYCLFQKYRKMMENEFNEQSILEDEEHILYEAIPDEDYVYEFEPQITPPPIWKLFN